MSNNLINIVNPNVSYTSNDSLSGDYTYINIVNSQYIYIYIYYVQSKISVYSLNIRLTLYRLLDIVNL